PRAVQRALSQLEQRASEHGSKAAVIRARMMGIRVVAGGDGSQEDGADPSQEGNSPPKPRAGALWSRATAYGTAAGNAHDGADAASGGGEPELSSAGATTATAVSGTQASKPSIARRSPAIKRALPPTIPSSEATAVTAGAISTCMPADPNSIAASSEHESTHPAIT
ncbi:hypothetical protein Agub_g9593, partial [Astrephomene gubernaculifera]